MCSIPNREIANNRTTYPYLKMLNLTIKKERDEYIIQTANPEDIPGAYHVCLKTGNYGEDATLLYLDDPDALGRIFVGPYITYEPQHCLILKDRIGICGYALAALDSKAFYNIYENEWRPELCKRFPKPGKEKENQTPVEMVYTCYHIPDYTVPQPYEEYPSHLHIDLLKRAQGQGLGRILMKILMDILSQSGSLGVHLGVSKKNTRAIQFYTRLGFVELFREEGDEGCIYMGIRLHG